MKTLRALLIALALLPPAAALRAEPEEPPPMPGDEEAGPRPMMPRVSPQGQEGHRAGERMREKFREQMSPEVRERFDAAREKALQDPKIRELREKAEAAGEEFRKAMREAMLKADPGLADLIKEKMENRGGMLGEKRMGGREERGFADLSDAERAKLDAARDTAKNDPSVKAAAEKMKSASSPDERREAMKAFHEAMRQAMLKADPSVGPIIEKIKPPQPNEGRKWEKGDKPGKKPPGEPGSEGPAT